MLTTATDDTAYAQAVRPETKGPQPASRGPAEAEQVPGLKSSAWERLTVV